MLNFLLKVGQMAIGRIRAFGQRHGKTRALATASVSGCRACSPRPTGTAPWKRRSNRALVAGFQLVGHGLNDCHRVTS